MITLTAYAALRGVSVKAISKAVATGRLSASVARDRHGAPKIADPELADKEWAENTRTRIDRPPPIRQGTPAGLSGVDNSSKVDAYAGSSPVPDTEMHAPRRRRAELPDSDGIPDYNTSRAIKEAASARKEAAAADMAELDLAERRGELVPADQARAEVIERYTLTKTKLLGVPSRIAQRLPHLAAEVVPVADELIRETLEELSGS